MIGIIVISLLATVIPIFFIMTNDWVDLSSVEYYKSKLKIAHSDEYKKGFQADLDEAKAEVRNQIAKALAVVITTFIVTYVISVLAGLALYREQLQRFNAYKYTIENCITQEDSNKMYNSTVLESISEINGNMAILKYKKDKWYGCLIPDEVRDVELITITKN